MSSSKRFFLAQDNSYHWHLVDASKRREWNQWLELPESSPKSWETPEFAESLEGNPSNMEFENPTPTK